MFVRKSKYEEILSFGLGWQAKYRALLEEHNEIVGRFNPLAEKWGALINRINALGGEDYLQRGEAAFKDSQFTADDVQRLLMLCHPDKHDGKQMATDMTAKLLKLKEAMK